MERTVKTKEEFQKAINERVDRIIIIGPYAEELIRKKRKKKKRLLWGGAILTALSAAAIPFTFGASATGIVAGMGLTATAAATLTVSAAELAIFFAGVIGIVGVVKGAKITWDYNDGKLVVEPKYKDS